MLRLVVLVLMLLNLGYLAWGQGWLLPYGLGPVSQREPQRLARQIRPEAIQILKTEEVGQLAAPEGQTGRLECLQSELMNAVQVDKLRPLLQGALPAQAWTLEELMTPERWIVYMGKFENSVELEKKRAELTRLGIAGEAPRNPALAPGIALGAFDLEGQAQASMKTWVERGVRTARVVQDLPAQQRFRLRLPVVDEAVRAKLAVIQTGLPGQGLQPCAVASTPD